MLINLLKIKIKYDLKIKLEEFMSLKLKDLNLKTRVKGYLVYRSKTNQIFGNLKTNFKGQGT